MQTIQLSDTQIFEIDGNRVRVNDGVWHQFDTEPVSGATVRAITGRFAALIYNDRLKHIIEIVGNQIVFYAQTPLMPEQIDIIQRGDVIESINLIKKP